MYNISRKLVERERTSSLCKRCLLFRIGFKASSVNQIFYERQKSPLGQVLFHPKKILRNKIFLSGTFCPRSIENLGRRTTKGNLFFFCLSAANFFQSTLDSTKATESTVVLLRFNYVEMATLSVFKK